MTEWTLEGKTVLITGATGGIGLAAAVAMARQGAHLVLVGRNQTRGLDAISEIRRRAGSDRAEFLRADFSSLAEVRRLALALLAEDRPLHVLVNNAGTMNTSRKLTVDGFEEMFAVNHLAHFLLTRLLLPRLQACAPSRIVHVASNAHSFCKGMRWHDLSHEREFSAFPAYGHSKLANILFSNELARRLRGSGVTSNALHPGAVATGIGSNNGITGRVVPLLLKPFFRSPARGAATTVYLASAAEIDGVTGKYFYDSKPADPKPWALDTNAAGRLWVTSEKLLGDLLA
ncbi:MAG TPA: SDR family oxidoreductase, partial [Pseudomonadales bacterium]|nr:SDR family oxidoreductase [Pseudomonadales bacterium]